MLAPGNVIGGRYRLVRLLGEGGMGVVWAAVNDAFGREVAIKVMRAGVAAEDPTAIERFFTEARICGSIRDPGIVDVLDVGYAENGAPFLVMELLSGDSLDTVLQRAGTLRPLDVLPAIRDVARTLALAHDKGVIHRDIKPGNVFLHRLPSGQVVAKLLDFGVSKVTSASAPATVTRTGMVCGSPAYMSPEQAGGRLELDGRSDVYGLGVILYEALAGRLPFLDTNYNALMIEIAVHDPPPLGSVAQGLPKAVLELVKAAMARDRDARLPSAAALAERISATLVALGVSAGHALPDPSSLAGVSGPRSQRRISGAQTSSALATNAGRRGRGGSPWRTVAIIAAITVLGGVITFALVWFKAPASPPRPAAALSSVSSAAEAPTTAPVSPPLAAPLVASSAAPSVAPAAVSAAPVAPSAAPPAPRTPGRNPVKKKGVWTYD